MRWGRLAMVSAAIAAGAAPAAAAWQQASSRHFVVYADDAPDKVAAFATRLERHDKVMRVLRSLPDPAISPDMRVTIFVVPTQGMVARLSGSGNAAGVYMPRASGPIAMVPKSGNGDGSKTDLTPEAVLFHEYAHHLMYSTSADAVIPPWLSEGFAEFHATTSFRPDGSVMVGRVPLYRAWGIVEGGDLSVEKLLTTVPDRLDLDAAQKFYGRGWLLTHYLTLDAGRRGQLTAYIAAITAGKPPAEAAKAFGDPRALSRAMDKYIGGHSLPAVTVPAERLPIDPVTVRALGPGEAAVMPALIRSRAGVDKRTAPEVAALARRAAAPFPTDAAAQNELSEAEFDAGDDAAALAAATRAYAAAPKSVHAMMYAGMAELRAAVARPKDKPRDAAGIARARGWFSRANHLDPENPWPMEQYYLSYVAAGDTPTHNAEDGLLYARELAPFDAELGMIAAYIYLRRDKPDDAARVLKPIAYNPHGGSAATAAQGALAAIAKDGAAAAAARLAPTRDEAKDGKDAKSTSVSRDATRPATGSSSAVRARAAS